MAPRQLSLFDAVMMVMGGIIGVGIFFTPANVAASVPQTGLFLAMWVIGGLVALCGALTFAELGGTFPREGGWYVFLREAFGAFPAFLFAWVVLFAISTGAIAVMVGFFTSKLCELFPALGTPAEAPARWIGAGVIVGLTVVSMLGVKVGVRFQNACMLTKLAAVAALMIGGLVFFAPGGASAPPPVAVPLPAHGTLFAGMIAALLPVFFTCGGWQMVCYIAPQVRDPRRTVPRAIVIGVIGVVAVYLLLNLVYLRVLGIGGLAGNGAFSTQVARITLGSSGANVLAAALCVSAIGITIVNVLATPWMYVAMAREGLFFKRFAELHPRTGAPILALTMQAGMSLAYWFLGSADVLVNSTVFVEWVFHFLVALALLRLRATRGDLPRPFVSPLYPLAPVVYLVIAACVVGGNLWQADARSVGIGLGVLALGGLIYKPWRMLVSA